MTLTDPELHAIKERYTRMSNTQRDTARLIAHVEAQQTVIETRDSTIADQEETIKALERELRAAEGERDDADARCAELEGQIDQGPSPRL